MKVYHFSNWAPRRSGLYECTKDQIKYERKHGIDSQMIVSELEEPNESFIDDGWLRPIPWSAANDADLFVVHRGVPEKLLKHGKPEVLVIHGTVEFIMLEEVYSQAEKSGFNNHINLIKGSTKSVAVNQHDYDIYKLYDEFDNLSLIHDAIDVERFTIEGNKYPYNRHPQILFADSLRPNKYPAHAIWAMSEVVKRIPEARLTVVGLDLMSAVTWRNLILRSPKGHLAANIENIQLLTNDNASYMRGADILVNGNMSGIPSRVELEAMACGCQVVGFGDFTPWTCKPFDIKDMADKICKCWDKIKKRQAKARQEARAWVLENANMEKAVVEKYIPLYETVLRRA